MNLKSSILILFFCIGLGTKAQENPPSILQNTNWTSAISYNRTGVTIAKGINFFNELGKKTESQSWDAKSNKIWGSKILYDIQGRSALQTFSVPVGSSFGHKSNFILNSNMQKYNLEDFDTPQTLHNPKKVYINSYLGTYFSENNETNKYQDITSYPFSRIIYSQLNPGKALKNIGGNKMGGEWKNGYVFSMPAGQELTQSIAFGDPKYNGNSYKIIKTIARDVHGVETVVFTDTDGRTLAAARSGNEEGGTTTRTSNVKISEQGYVDIHIPVGLQGITLKNENFGILTNNHWFKVYNLITEEITTAAFESLPSGFYRISFIASGLPLISVTYPENYYDYSLNEYDKAGRLLSSKQPLTKNDGTNQKLESTFRYNALGQLTYSKSEDEGDAWFKYRSDGQIRFSQNSKQKEALEFSYTHYDKYGRPIESGVCKESSDYSFNLVNPTQLDNISVLDATYTYDALIFDTDHFKNQDCKERHITVYDALPQNDSDILPKNYKNPTFLAGNVAKTWNENTTTWYSYDIYGRVQWIVQNITGLGIKTIDYEYDPISSQVTQVIYQKHHAADRFIHRYTYDSKDYSLTKAETSVDGNNYTEHAAYTYYETGALKRLNLAQGLQGIDYVYNLNGALKSINHPIQNMNTDPGGDVNGKGVPTDLFGMNIHYYNNDYTRTNTPTPVAGTSAGIDQYNGNIKAITWNTRGQNSTSPDTYYYKYNKNNWLEGASFNQAVNGVDPSIPHTIVKNEAITATESAEATQSIKMQPGFKVKATSALSFTTNIAKDDTVQGDGDYNVSGITYDANGNIKTLNRNKDTHNGKNVMDKLSYTYDVSKPNQLKQVTDGAGNVDGADDIGSQTNPDNYTYNTIGQLISNKSENIDYFYNASGLVIEIRRLGVPLVKFFYNDKGHRVRKESYNTKTGGIIYTEHYIRDASGTALAIYRDGQVIENTIYGSGRLGVRKSDGTHLYQLTDHLGNVRAVVGRNPQGQAMALTTATDYYPFGMPMPGRTLSGAEGYRYAYQGQEKDPETGKEAFQLRLWDARIGRWLTTDPKGEFVSPYLGMGNNPIVLIDPDGGSTGLHDMKVRKYRQQAVKMTNAWVKMTLLNVSFMLNSGFDLYSNNMETFDKILPPDWLTTASGHRGIKEVKENKGVQVEKYLKSCGIGKGNAWCAAFVNYHIEFNGKEGVIADKTRDTHPSRALSWRKWLGGTKLNKPALGALATKTRTGGGHIGFVAGKNKDGKIVVLGGNQSDQVKYNVYSSSILQFHYPKGEQPNYDLPMYNLDSSGVAKEN